MAEEKLLKRINAEEQQHDVIRAYGNKNSLINRNELINKYKLNPNKKIVLVMPHIFADAPHGNIGMIFRDYMDWLKETCLRLDKNNNINYVIKEHPSADLYNEQGILKKSIEDIGLGNKMLESNINTKSFFDLIDVVVTCTGTAGMEFPCFGVPVLLASKTPYCLFPYIRYPDKKEEYMNEIDNIHTYNKLSENDIKKAKAIYYAIQILMKVDTQDLGLGSQKFDFEKDIDFDLFLKEMIEETRAGRGYHTLKYQMELFLKSKYKYLLNYKVLDTIIR